jgi:hypothetical protein
MSNKLPSVWITYAWSDNSDQEFDYLAEQLRKRGLDVRFDRVQLLAGQRLWFQIADHIQDQSLDAWAILVTENSLRSEACREELSYALDRALSERGAEFPLIGIVPGPVDRSLLPLAIKSRLYINLSDPTWRDQVFDAVVRQKSEPDTRPVNPFGLREHLDQPLPAIEFWPRIGTWSPFFVAVPRHDAECISFLYPGSRGFMPGGIVTSVAHGYRQFQTQDGAYEVHSCDDEISATRSAHVIFNKIPDRLIFGGSDGQRKYEFEWSFNKM